MSSNAVATYVHARDPISRSGVASQLKMRPEIRVVDTAADAAVAVMVADIVDELTTRDLRLMRKGRWETSFRVRGTFEVRGGKIAVWDDAFSWLDFARGSLVGLTRVF